MITKLTMMVALERCTEDNACTKLEDAMESGIKDERHRHHAAAKRLKVILGGTSYDIFCTGCLLP